MTNNLADLDHDGTWLTGYRKDDPDKKTGQFPSNFMRKAVSKKAATSDTRVSNSAMISTADDSVAAINVAMEPPSGLGLYDRLLWKREHTAHSLPEGPVPAEGSMPAFEASMPTAEQQFAADGLGPPPEGHGALPPEPEQQQAGKVGHDERYTAHVESGHAGALSHQGDTHDTFWITVPDGVKEGDPFIWEAPNGMPIAYASACASCLNELMSDCTCFTACQVLSLN